MWRVELVVIVGMVAVNAIFAAYEIALASVSLGRLQALAGEGRRGAAAAAHMKQRMEGSLAVVQLGITLFGAIAAATGGAGAEEDLAPILQRAGLSPSLAEVVAIALVVIPLTAVTIVFGELVPKLFALRNQEWVCLRLSPGMKWFSKSVWPAVWLLENSATAAMNWSERRWKPMHGSGGKTEASELQDLRAVASLARTARLIGAREENIILGAARLSSRTLREIMLPAEHISLLSIGESVANSLVAAHLDMHTRYPITERPGDPQGIVGYANFKDIVACLRTGAGDPSLRSILRPLQSLSDSISLSTALESLIRQHTHIALIRDGAGQVVGMITLEDIIEELIGDVQDEYDLLPQHVASSGAGWVVGGGVLLSQLRDQIGIDLTVNAPASRPRTLSGWVLGHVGHAVHGGESVERGGVRVIVRKIRRQQVLEAQIHRVGSSSHARQEPPPA